MMSTRILLLLFGFGGAVMMTVGAARADTMDERYLESLHEVGIYAATGDAGLITMGHIVCNAFGIGESFSDVELLIVSNNPKLSSTGAAQVIGAATGAYCPGYAWKFGGGSSTASAPHRTGVMA